MTSGVYKKTAEHIKNATHKQTQETKDKISKSRLLRKERLGYLNSKETREEISNSNKGRIPWNKGINMWEGKEHPRGMLGKHFSEEHKQKMSESHKGKKMSEESKRKMSKSRLGTHPSRETIEKMKNRIISKETREKMSISSKGRKASEETKKKMSVSLKGKKHIIINKGNMGKNPNSRNNIAFVKGGIGVMKGRKYSAGHRKKLEEKVWGKRRGKDYENIYGKEKAKVLRNKHKELRAKQTIPFNDTTIEVKIQNYLKQLNIIFYTHKRINDIKYSYPCDIFIPIQEGINKKTIIECDGDYFHSNIEKYDFKKLPNKIKAQKVLDFERTNQLEEKGYRVIRLWEHKIRKISLEELKEKVYGRI